MRPSLHNNTPPDHPIIVHNNDAGMCFGWLVFTRCVRFKADHCVFLVVAHFHPSLQRLIVCTWSSKYLEVGRKEHLEVTFESDDCPAVKVDQLIFASGAKKAWDETVTLNGIETKKLKIDIDSRLIPSKATPLKYDMTVMFTRLQTASLW